MGNQKMASGGWGLGLGINSHGTQGDHRIHARGAARRQPAGKECAGQQCRRPEQQRERVQRRDIKDQAAQKTADAEIAGQEEIDAESGIQKPLVPDRKLCDR